MDQFYVVIISALFLLFGFCCFVIARRTIQKPSSTSMKGLHVLITGGSSGIGKCMAFKAAKLGANVTIIARDMIKLINARCEIEQFCQFDDQRIQYIALDISKNYEQIEQEIGKAERDLGPIHMLVNCAGLAVCGKFEDISIEDAYHMIDVNFKGTMHATKAVVKKMKERRCGGRIVITASLAALVGIFGYTVYTGTKYALRGFAEALYMEVKPYGISVTVGLPPDTDTPGFANEEKSKPLETKLISETGGLYQPQVIADKLMKDALNGKFFSTVGFEGYLMTVICCGMSPFSSYFELLAQVLLMGIIRLIIVFYQLSFHRIIKNCMGQEDLKCKKEN